MNAQKHAAPVFKPYLQKQQMLIPPSLDELVPVDHPARIIDALVEGIDLSPLYETYAGGGTSSYDPGMLLKVLVYAYSQRTYSSRRIAQALKENVAYMWLAGGSTPDFRTLASFRSGRLKEVIGGVFGATVEGLMEAGYVKLDHYFLDGTKVEANANKYSFVWKRATEKFKARLEEQIRATIAEIDRVNAEEDAACGEEDLPEIVGTGPLSSEKLKETVAKLNAKIAACLGDEGESKKKLAALEKEQIPRLEKYERQLQIAGDRNSYSKTDHDATFMGMKEDPMRNHQLKAAYNIQMGTENQFIVGYSVHQSPTDSPVMIPHLEHLERTLGRLPAVVVADAGYGSEENYEHLERNGVSACVKYGMFHTQRRRAYRKDVFRKENWEYDERKDAYICPCGDELRFEREEGRRTATGYLTRQKVYMASHCPSCPWRRYCTSASGCRTIQVNAKADLYRARARALLESDEGISLRRKRCVEVESVWGHIKQDRGFRRFLCRGLGKVKTEWGLLAMAHNCMKLAAIKA
jgi:transposase